jgi:hypothetical protein
VISINETVSGTLTTTDLRLDDGSYADTYTFNGEAGQRLNVGMSSQDVDAFLMILGPNNFQQSNDDIAPGILSAALDLNLPSTGTYTIVANTAVAEQTGQYTVSLVSLDAAPARAAPTRQPAAPRGPQAARPQPSRQQPAQQARAASGGPLRLGETVTGTLTSSDPTLSDGTHVHSYQFNGAAGQRVAIVLESGAFDSVLLVTGPNGYQQMNDDASPQTFNSRLDLTLPTAGTYTIAANTVQAGATGAYRMSVTGAGGPAAGPPPPPPSTASARQGAQQPAAVGQSAPGRITLGQTITGALASSDRTLNSNTHVHAYQFTGQAGQRITVTMDSTSVDSRLVVSGPNNFSQINDDASPQTLNARLDLTLPVAGTYVIGATTAVANQTGPYSLTIARTGSQTTGRNPPQQPARQQAAGRQPARQQGFNAAAECPPMPEGANPNIQGRRLASGGPIRFDEPVCGRLQQGDQALDDGSFVDVYTIDLQPAGQYGYQAILQVEGFEPNVIVLPPGNNQSAVEVMPISSGISLNAAITVHTGGTYRIAVNSMTAGSGRYRFRVVRTAD